MSKLYIVQWGFHSCMESDPAFKAICSTLERAIEIVEKELTDGPYNCKKPKKDQYYWTDGDYYISIGTGYLDSEYWYESQETVDSWMEDYNNGV